LKSVPRLLAAEVEAAARHFPALIVTGPRRAGKTTLLRKTFPRATYRLLEDPETVALVRADPRGFLASLEGPVILDEVQNVPELLSWVRAAIDLGPKRNGRWLLTGSQEAPLMRGVTESMAGRAAVFGLLPLAHAESAKVSLLHGGFPEVLSRPQGAQTWFRSYVQTWLERDVRAITAVRDLSTFRRFLALVATRIGQVLNRTDLAAPLGVSVPTVIDWLGILETTGQVILVPPYFENFGKRLIKSPKVYFADTGLACFLLGIDSRAELERSPFLGPLFECFVASEIAKLQAGAGRRRELYFFRDQQGLEVDFVVPTRGGRLALFEAKAGATLEPRMAASMQRLGQAMTARKVSKWLVHRPVAGSPRGATVGPGTKPIDLAGLAEALELP
jgi:uncharacterized protein